MTRSLVGIPRPTRDTCTSYSWPCKHTPTTVPYVSPSCLRVGQIIGSMKRDFLASGRQPAGVCCAALTLATRVNRIERSKEEIRKVCMHIKSTVPYSYAGRERLGLRLGAAAPESLVPWLPFFPVDARPKSKPGAT